ncbi:FkbM family methyltransferase [Synechococcus sp. EJ6-Ellesmere]|uniref:FkbM family methyltransferase n=1 Tax=Synechococcus sp. EJ6-Ellesmere TaxID=2823734 RepID=UPI0020CD967B|nr:FkbM family methyltransferase [Synechococcus sp. EJ6-Ellesmere]MCP9826040.1 FkbM family methyltransferase [Synechococcus sp. EJ6-Ellesmere]
MKMHQNSPQKILIDEGGFNGTATLAALDPIFEFDKIFTIEPSARLVSKIKNKISDPRVTVLKCALSNKTATSSFFNSGNPGGSVYQQAPAFGSEGVGNQSIVQLVDASLFVDIFINNNDLVFMKLNCEGSEVDILESLLLSGKISRIKNMLIDLDALKIESEVDRALKIMASVRQSGASFFTPEEVQFNMVTNYGGIHNWLQRAGAESKKSILLRKIKSILYNINIFLNHPDCNGYHKMLLLRKFPFLKVLAKSNRRKE